MDRGADVDFRDHLSGCRTQPGELGFVGRLESRTAPGALEDVDAVAFS